LRSARQAFAELGYEVTTNRIVASGANVTAGSLYHYFDSKLDMYLTVFDDVQTFIAERTGAAIVGHDTFVAKLSAFLDEVAAINLDDPSIARFVESSRIDISRHAELRQALSARLPGEGVSVVPGLVETAVATGEIAAADAPMLTDFLRTVFVGLVDAVSSDPVAHRRAINATLAVLNGSLIRTKTRPAGSATT
jgi:AcrR family transcriptional regulator